MEIVLALMIGLAVACVVFICGRMLMGPRTASDQVDEQPPLSLFPGATADPVGDAIKNDHETAVVDAPAPVSEPREITAPRKVRKKSAARSDDAKVASRPRGRRTKETTVPGSDAVQ